MIHSYQINYYLDVINPIKLESLASYIDMDINLLKEKVVKFVNKNKLNARIIKDELYSPKREDFIEPRDILFFKNIKTIGNKLFFNFKLNTVLRKALLPHLVLVDKIPIDGHTKSRSLRYRHTAVLINRVQLVAVICVYRCS